MPSVPRRTLLAAAASGVALTCLVASAAGEGSVAIQQVHQYLQQLETY